MQRIRELISGSLYRFIIRFLSGGSIYPLRREMGHLEISFRRLSQVPASRNNEGGGFIERGLDGIEYQLYAGLYGASERRSAKA